MEKHEMKHATPAAAPVSRPCVGLQTCFEPGTLIATPLGARAVETLAAGDLVRTFEGRYVRILWASGRAEVPGQASDGQMVRIAPGALGANLPDRALRLAPDHGVLVSSHIAGQMVGQDEVLVPAESLLGLPGVTRAASDPAGSEIHMLLEGHHILLANGLPVESLFIGKDTRDRLGRVSWRALRATLSRPPFVNGRPRMIPARLRIDAKRAQRLIERHLRNPHRDLIAGPGGRPRQLRLVAG